MTLLILTSCAFPSFTLSFEVQPVLPSSQHTTPISYDEPPLAGTEPEYLHLPPPHLAWPLHVHTQQDEGPYGICDPLDRGVELLRICCSFNEHC
jgi:hypothetical protein